MKRVVNILWASFLAGLLMLARLWPWLKIEQRALINDALGEYDKKIHEVPPRFWIGLTKIGLVLCIGYAFIYRYTPQQPFILLGIAVIVAIFPAD